MIWSTITAWCSRGIWQAVPGRCCGADSTTQLLRCIRDKNRHELRRCAAQAGLSPQGTEALCRLWALNGPWETVMDAAEPLALNAAMGSALAELRGRWDRVGLFGSSLGAWFGLLAYPDAPLAGALFLSPVVDWRP